MITHLRCYGFQMGITFKEAKLYLYGVIKNLILFELFDRVFATLSINLFQWGNHLDNNLKMREEIDYWKLRNILL